MSRKTWNASSARRLFMNLTMATSFIVGQMPTAHAEGVRGLDGVELEAVPLDTGTDCSSIILKGTRRFQGTAFVMPRVLVGITREGEDLFQISPDSQGGYVLSLGLYFPDATTNLDLRAGRSTLFLHGCNFEAALHQINRDVQDPKAKVNSLGRLPVQSIEVVVDGLKDRATIGELPTATSSGTSILNYEGNDHTVEFKMTKAEKEGLMRRLKRQQGISIRVNMRFTARSNDGALYAEVDLEQLATSLQTEIGGKYMIASGDLKVAIERSISNMHINIQTEAGSGEAFQKISDSLMNMILANVVDGTPSAPQPRTLNNDEPAKDKNANNDDSGDDDGDKSADKPAKTPLKLPTAPTPSKAPTGKAVRHVSPDKVKLENPVGPAASLAPASIKVSAVMSYLKTSKKRVINYSNSSELQTAVYTTPVNLQARLQDPDVREVIIRSGEQPSAMPDEIVAGDKVTIGVAKAIKEKIEYKGKKSFLTANELTRLNLGDAFPEILAENFIVNNEDTKQGFLAVGKKIYKRSFWFSDYVYPQRYFWVREQWGPLYGVERETALEPSLEALKGLALKATFSRVGTRQFQIAELVQNNAYFSASYDEVGGKIELTAKKDLGFLTLTGAAPLVKSKVTVEQFVEETREAKKPIVRSEAKNVRESIVPVERLSYQVFVGRPGIANEGVQVVTPNGVPMSGPTPADAAPQADTDDLEQP